MKVTWAPLALDRAAEAYAYIAADNASAAEDWLAGLLEAGDNLSIFPERGRTVPEVGRNDVREVFYGAYRIVYRVDPTEVVVLTVRHGRRLLDEREF
jgi:plasmid stabilization system protein ParE